MIMQQNNLQSLGSPETGDMQVNRNTRLDYHVGDNA